MSPVSVRLAVLSDVEDLLDMMEDFNQIERIPWSREAARPAVRRLLGESSIGVVEMVLIDGKSNGYFILTFGYDLEFNGRDAFLTELYLRQDQRGKGYAKRVLAEIDLIAKGAGVKAIHLLVRPENRTALRAYQRANYVASPRLMMTKILDASLRAPPSSP